MRLLLCSLALLGSTTAWAGGLGIVGTSGIHADPVYFYDSADDFKQYRLSETIVGYGAGIEGILGDRDDRVMGIFRFFWNQETPERDPAGITDLVAPGDVVAAWREEPRNVGWATVGIQWGFWGDPDGFQLTANGAVGSAFLTSNHSEFLSAELGPGVSYTFGRSFQAFGDVVYQVRYRKRFAHGPRAYAGVRVLFD